MLATDLATVRTVELRDDTAFEGLTPKLYRFVKAAFSGMSYADAYRESHDCSNMAEATIRHNAATTANLPNVQAKLKQLRQQADDQATLAPSITREWIAAGIRNLAVNASKENVQLAAYIALGKMAGIDMFRETTRVERVERTVEDVERELQTRLKALAATIEGTARSVSESEADSSSPAPVDVETRGAGRKRKPRAPVG